MTLLRLALATGILLLPGAVVARALGLRGLVFRDERGRMYRDAASWLASGRVPELLDR